MSFRNDPHFREAATTVQKLIIISKAKVLPLQGQFNQLAKGQHPETLFITCFDSRSDPTLLTKAQHDNLFILRNAGNIIPPRDLFHRQ